MDNKLKILMSVGAIFFVCLVVWTIRTTPKAPPIIETVEPPATMEYEGNTIVEEVNGKKIWEITSDRIRVDTANQNVEFETINGKFYQEDGRVLELTANEGNYNQKTRDIHVEGEVKVVDSDGSTLTSEELNYTGKDGTIIALDNVQITKDDLRAFGDRAESSDGFQHFFLKGHARVQKGVKDTEESRMGNVE